MAAILSAVLKLVHYATSLPLEKPHLATRKQSHVIFDPTSHSTKQLLHFQYTLYHMMGGVLGGAGLAQKVSTHGYYVLWLWRCRVRRCIGVALLPALRSVRYWRPSGSGEPCPPVSHRSSSHQV